MFDSGCVIPSECFLRAEGSPDARRVFLNIDRRGVRLALLRICLICKPVGLELVIRDVQV